MWSKIHPNVSVGIDTGTAGDPLAGDEHVRRVELGEHRVGRHPDRRVVVDDLDVVVATPDPQVGRDGVGLDVPARAPQPLAHLLRSRPSVEDDGLRIVELTLHDDHHVWGHGYLSRSDADARRPHRPAAETRRGRGLPRPLLDW
jgi:hypothetical protein